MSCICIPPQWSNNVFLCSAAVTPFPSTKSSNARSRFFPSHADGRLIPMTIEVWDTSQVRICYSNHLFKF